MAILAAQESMITVSRRLTLRQVATGLSCGNLCFLRRWKELLTYTARDEYFMNLPPSPAQYYAAIFNVLLLGSIFSLLYYLVTRVESGRYYKVTRIGYLLLLAIPLNALREALSDYFPYLRGPLIRLIGESAAFGLFALIGALLVLAFIVWPIRVYAAVATLLAILVVFVPMTIGQALWRASQYDSGPFLDRPTAPPIQSAKAPDVRVVWIVFDEMDQRLAFDERRSDLKMPELDRLRKTAVCAVQAFPPSGSTSTSLPSLIGGRLVKYVQITGPTNLSIRYFGSSQFVHWTDEPNIFRRARAMGLNVGLGGWYHPYCRLLASDVTYCEWEPIELVSNTVGRTFGLAAANQLRSLFETSIYSPFGQSLDTKTRVRREAQLLDWGKRLTADPSIGVVFLHLQPPHTPFTYNRRSGTFDLRNSGVQGYIDALADVDRTFGEIRRAMEKARLWESSAVLVSSDHWYRSATVLDGKSDHRIPFLLKLPGQTSAATYSQPFNTVVSQELVQCILKKQLFTSQDVVRWLDVHRNDVPVHPF